MDVYEYVFKGLVSIIGFGILGWCGYIMRCTTKNSEAINRIDGEMSDHVLEDARLYVLKTDFKETFAEIKDTVKRMYERIDQILDKLK